MPTCRHSGAFYEAITFKSSKIFTVVQKMSEELKDKEQPTQDKTASLRASQKESTEEEKKEEEEREEEEREKEETNRRGNQK